jgi:SAM-dependent methyltransferase
MLDIGSSEGSITGAMADIFRIPPSSAFACDVTPLAPHASGTTANKFTFSLLPKDTSVLPYKSDFFDLVTCQMTLHHVQDQLGMINEVARVLKPGGILIIREHDMKEPGFRLVLDIMHGLYALVWSDPQEDPTFISTYYASYRSRQDWAGMIKSVGLSSIDQPSSNNNRGHYNAANAYFDAFRKTSAAASAIQQDKKRKRDDDDEEKSTSAQSKRAQAEEDVDLEMVPFENKIKRRSDDEPSFENM